MCGQDDVEPTRGGLGARRRAAIVQCARVADICPRSLHALSYTVRL